MIGVLSFRSRLFYQKTIITNKQTRFVKLVLIGQKILLFSVKICGERVKVT